MSTRPFRAFVSYCHADRVFAAALQRRLESYRLPGRLAGQVPPLEGQAAGWIGPIFRDRADLSAAIDLSDAVREAIGASSALIVVASPDAARSHWVSREIALFREMHPKAQVLVALVRGSPEEAMPEALRRDGAEPLAADFRAEGDGRRIAFLKIVAGLAELPLDALVQRDAQRRLRRVTAVTLGALLVALMMAAVAAFALASRAQAVRERNQAEGLIEFMLTDLRQELEGVGRLDLMKRVNARAIAYYAAQGDLSRLPDESLLRRARLVHAMGADDAESGDDRAALAKFVEAERVTEGLLARRPADTDRIFGHAQSAFWLGSAAWKVRDYATARRYFERYAVLAAQLVETEPGKRDWQMEAGYAASNLGSLAMRGERQPGRAEADFVTAGRHFEAALRIDPGNAETLRELADNHGWLADSLFAQRRYPQALAERLTERGLLERLAAKDPRNARFARDLVESSIGIARVEMALGREGDAFERLRAARERVAVLVARDPGNKATLTRKATVELYLAALILARGDRTEEAQAIVRAARAACATAGALPASEEQQRLCEDVRTRGRRTIEATGDHHG